MQIYFGISNLHCQCKIIFLITQMNIPFGFLLLQHDHGVCLPQQGPGSSKFSQFYQLQHDLLVQVYQLLIRQLERLNCLQNCVPMSIIDVGTKPVNAVYCIQGNSRLLLKKAFVGQVLSNLIPHPKRTILTCKVCKVFVRFDSFRYCCMRRITLWNKYKL